MDQSAHTLASLASGHRGVIIGFHGDEDVRSRLHGLGLRRGLDLEVVQGTQSQGYVIRVLEGSLALNADLAKSIRIRRTA